MSLYVLLFQEVVQATLWPAFSEVYGYAMQAFGGFSMLLVTLLSVAGVCAGGLALWLAARFMAPITATGLSARYEKLRLLMNGYGKWTLLFTFSPIGFAVAIAAGLFRVPLRTALPLMAGGAAVFYSAQFIL